MAQDVRKIGHRMPKGEMKKWANNYKAKYPTSTHGFLYGADILTEMLADKKCAGIWFFKGLDEKGNEKLILYKADNEGNILNGMKSLGAAAMQNGNDDPADNGETCPPRCPQGWD
jgi:hypothetical protein